MQSLHAGGGVRCVAFRIIMQIDTCLVGLFLVNGGCRVLPARGPESESVVLEFDVLRLRVQML